MAPRLLGVFLLLFVCYQMTSSDENVVDVNFSPSEAQMTLDDSQKVRLDGHLHQHSENFSMTIVNISYTSSDLDVASVQTGNSQHLLVGGNNHVNTTFVVQAGSKPGRASIQVKLSSYFNETVYVITYTYDVTVVRVVPDFRTNHILYYISLALALVCIMSASCGLRMADLKKTWENAAWILTAFFFQSIVVPLIGLACIKMFQISSDRSVGVLACLAAPPAILTIPLATVLEADISISAMATLATILMGTGVLPIWSLEFEALDGNMGLRPFHVPYGAIIIELLITSGVIFLGVYIRLLRPDAGRSFHRLTKPLAVVTLVFSIICHIYTLADLFDLVGWKTGLFACLEPLLIVTCTVATILGCNLEIPRVKSLGSFLLIKGSLITLLTLKNGLEQPELENAMAASSFVALVSECVALSVCVCQCAGGRCLGRQGDGGNQELITEVDQDKEHEEEVTVYHRVPTAEETEREKDRKQAAMFGAGIAAPGVWVWT